VNKQIHLEKQKGKADSLNEKLNKTNNKDMKEHLYIPAAFFEQFREIFIHSSGEIYNIQRPEILTNLCHLKTFTYLSQDIPDNFKNDVDYYGEILKENYLRQEYIIFNVGFK
jgi:hypothetical protein